MKPYYDHAGITIYHGEALNVLTELRSVQIGAVVAERLMSIRVGDCVELMRGWPDACLHEAHPTHLPVEAALAADAQRSQTRESGQLTFGVES